MELETAATRTRLAEPELTLSPLRVATPFSAVPPERRAVCPVGDDPVRFFSDPAQASNASRTPLDMRSACEYIYRMSRMIQIRNVPDELHRRLKARAALEGKTLSDYLLYEVQRLAELPTLAELRKRLAERSSPKLRVSPARAIRAERDGR